MYSQLEITTRCNFSCWYCAGRDMPQQDMAWSTFTAIVDAIAQPTSTVSLQGEGEPTLHPRFWDMAQYVRDKGHLPYSIVNGSRIDARRTAQMFPRIGISVDTLDARTAEHIGRHNLPKVLANLDALCAAMGPHRIVVMTVDLGQPLEALKAWAQQRGFGSHVIQPLMRKGDYAKAYPPALAQPVTWHAKPPSAVPPEPQTCQFLHQDVMRYHTWSGQALPCCFIKDTQGIDSIAGLRAMLTQGHVPAGCAGCRELKPLALTPCH